MWPDAWSILSSPRAETVHHHDRHHDHHDHKHVHHDHHGHYHGHDDPHDYGYVRRDRRRRRPRAGSAAVEEVRYVPASSAKRRRSRSRGGAVEYVYKTAR